MQYLSNYADIKRNIRLYIYNDTKDRLNLLAHTHTHTPKSLWEIWHLTVHEGAQQLRRFAKLQQEEGNATRDIPWCTWQTAGLLPEQMGWGRWRRTTPAPCMLIPRHTGERLHEVCLAPRAATGRGDSSASPVQETFPVPSQSKQQ